MNERTNERMNEYMNERIHEYVNKAQTSEQAKDGRTAINKSMKQRKLTEKKHSDKKEHYVT